MLSEYSFYRLEQKIKMENKNSLETGIQLENKEKQKDLGWKNWAAFYQKHLSKYLFFTMIGIKLI